jgi:integrase
MKTRPYPGKDGRRIWLSRREQRELLETVVDEPRRRLAIQLGLHGLRSEEIVDTDNSRGVTVESFREVANGGDGWILVVEDGKTGKRETPASADLVERARMLKSAARLRKDEPLVDVSTRTLRSWMGDAREELASRLEERDAEEWSSLGFHDLRRTWATDGYYSLAFSGVPIAEQLIMSWGGWAHTSTGRETFRNNYLGPVPDHITERALEDLALI